MTTIRRGRPRIGDAPTESVRLHARIPSRVKRQIDSQIGTDPTSLRIALGRAAATPIADRVLSYAPSDSAERDTSVALAVVVPRDLAQQLQTIYGGGSPGLLRAFATVLVARSKGAEGAARRPPRGVATSHGNDAASVGTLARAESDEGRCVCGYDKQVNDICTKCGRF